MPARTDGRDRNPGHGGGAATAVARRCEDEPKPRRAVGPHHCLVAPRHEVQTSFAGRAALTTLCLRAGDPKVTPAGEAACRIAVLPSAAPVVDHEGEMGRGRLEHHV